MAVRENEHLGPGMARHRTLGLHNRAKDNGVAGIDGLVKPFQNFHINPLTN
jgi:hypothetical protein